MIDSTANFASRDHVSVKQAFNDLVKNPENFKGRTLYDYLQLTKVVFDDWQDKAITTISKDMAAIRHRNIGAKRRQAYANLVMRFLRLLFNFAIAQYENGSSHVNLRENPVIRLT